MSPAMPIASPAEIQAVKDAILLNPRDLGVGIWHMPTDRLILAPFDQLNGTGHVGLVTTQGFLRSECRGFIISRQQNQWIVINVSELNGPQGQPGALAMPGSDFAAIEQSLRNAGL